MGMEALNLALNYIGCKVYICDVGATPTKENQILGVTRISNPGGVERNTQEYTTLEGDGYKKKVPTLKNVKDMTLDVAHEDEKSIELLNGLAVTEGVEMYKDFYYVPTKRTDWTNSGAFKCTIAVVSSTPNDAVADGFQATSYELAVQGAKTAFTGTIE